MDILSPRFVLESLQLGSFKLVHSPQEGGMTNDDVSSCLVYTCHPQDARVCSSLVMQSCVTVASSHDPDTKGGVLVIMAGESWTSLPPSWHLMPVMTPEIMKAINFIYPANIKVRKIFLFYILFEITHSSDFPGPC